MKATIRFHRKITLIRDRFPEVAIAELKVWSVSRSDHYPDGVKYSLFLVSKESGRIIVGVDNHKPKGPHLHYEGREYRYDFRGVENLIEDFWSRVEKEGFIL